MQDHFGSFRRCEFFRRKTFCYRMHSRVLLFRAPARTPSSHYLSALGRKILRYCKLQRAAIFVRRQTNRSASREEFCANSKRSRRNALACRSKSRLSRRDKFSHGGEVVSHRFMHTCRAPRGAAFCCCDKFCRDEL